MGIAVDDVRELNERVVELSRSYAILWVLWDNQNNKLYSKQIEDHRDFFNAIASSLIQGFCVIAYQLFDKRTDVKSLPTLIERIPSPHSSLASQLKQQIDSERPLLDKFALFRNKIFAHRDKAKRPWELFGAQQKESFKAEMERVVLT